jgi:hypothetical protein
VAMEKKVLVAKKTGSADKRTTTKSKLGTVKTAPMVVTVLRIGPY